ncbi:acyltransferase [Spirosoma panaciterrae]|uniref:acyltransferase n=1 Tax=Spirosoma panaciterrae TaxID=496058 RepID=UPI00035E41DF|nr:acyltransferase [Spirosoma panaciterrae]
MSYGNLNNYNTNFLDKVLIKIYRWIASSFPLNKVRIWALRGCGFSIGKDVYLGPDFLISMMNSNSSCSLVINDRVAIGPRVTIVLASDANWSHLTTYYSPIKGKVILGADCWLGTGCIILPNVSIGSCSVVAAGAVVTKDVPDYHVVAGVPAKTIKIIDKLAL